MGERSLGVLQIKYRLNKEEWVLHIDDIHTISIPQNVLRSVASEIVCLRHGLMKEVGKVDILTVS